LNGLRVKIAGFVHAGSYTKFDFVEKCQPFARFYEEAWDRVFDLIFVGSGYHAYVLSRDRGLGRNCCGVEITGNPYVSKEVSDLVVDVCKVDRVIHTNRPDPEKNPLATLAVFDRLKKKHPDWEFMVTTGRLQWGEGEIRKVALDLQSRGVLTIEEGISKSQYFRLLAASKVMTGNTKEENFGYCILEAMICGTVPVVERAYSHPSVAPDGSLFSSEAEQINLIEKYMVGQNSAIQSRMKELVAYFDDSLRSIVSRLKSLLQA
jgi:glycosyltransferase involved in cell wall biosynthesis